MILGIFDSGLGGLTVLKEILKDNTYDKIIYFADTLRLPYGEKDKDTLISLARNDISFLREKGAQEIILACGTVSTNALDDIKDDYDFKIVGIVDTVCKEAARITNNNKIGVIATPSTVKTRSFTKKIKTINDTIEVYEVPCQKLTPLIESEKINSKEMNDAIEEYLSGLKEHKIDVLILGCTHYPLLEEKIAKYFNGTVKLVSSGALLNKELNIGERKVPKVEFYVSGSKVEFKEKAKKVLNIKEIDLVQNC